LAKARIPKLQENLLKRTAKIETKQQRTKQKLVAKERSVAAKGKRD
jgi:hypothetical protein